MDVEAPEWVVLGRNFSWAQVPVGKSLFPVTDVHDWWEIGWVHSENRWVVVHGEKNMVNDRFPMPLNWEFA